MAIFTFEVYPPQVYAHANSSTYSVPQCNRQQTLPQILAKRQWHTQHHGGRRHIHILHRMRKLCGRGQEEGDVKTDRPRHAVLVLGSEKHGKRDQDATPHGSEKDRVPWHFHDVAVDV